MSQAVMGNVYGWHRYHTLLILTNLILLFLLQMCIKYTIVAAKLHIFFHISIKIIRKLFNILTI